MTASDGPVPLPQRLGRGVSAALFDVDDTLYDHTYALERAVAELQQQDPRLSAVPLRALVSKDQAILRDVHLGLVLPGKVTLPESRVLRMVRLYESQGIELGEPEAQRLSELRRRAYLANEQPVPGARTLLEELRSRRVHVGIISNNLLAEQRAKLSRIGLVGLLDSLTVSEEVQATKPDLRIFQLALTRCGRPPVETVVVGDSWKEDVEGAQAAGMNAVWFNRRQEPRPVGQNAARELGSFLPTATAVATILKPASLPG